MVRLSGQQGVPVTVIDGQVVLGADMPALDQLLSQREPGPLRLGVAIADAGRIAAKKKIHLPDGAYVGRVTPGSPAAMAGLRVGDVIVHLADRKIQTEQDVHRVTGALERDQEINLLAWRDGRVIGMKLRF
jgi:serine protease Do